MTSKLMLAAAFISLAAACTPAPAPAGTPEDAADAAPETLPATKPVTFEPLSTTAISITGSVSLNVEPRIDPNAPPAMKLVTESGLIFLTELIPGGVAQASGVDWSDIFGASMAADGMSPPGGPAIDMHAVISERVPNEATQGGLCGDQPTSYIAMATGLETSGQSFMSIAAFGGNTWPPLNDKALCGIFTYIPPGPK